MQQKKTVQLRRYDEISEQNKTKLNSKIELNFHLTLETNFVQSLQTSDVNHPENMSLKSYKGEHLITKLIEMMEDNQHP